MGDWPAWATARAEEVRTVLAPGERGPWQEPSSCVLGGSRYSPAPDHPAEPPYFYHCHEHLAIRRDLALRQRKRAKQPNTARDKGLCVKCGDLAELDRKYRNLPAVYAVQAELEDVTIARLMTRRFCVGCDPYRLPWCTARKCPDRSQGKHRALAHGCCHGTTQGRVYKSKAATSWYRKLAHCQAEHDRVRENKRLYMKERISDRTRTPRPEIPSTSIANCRARACMTKTAHPAVVDGCVHSKTRLAPHCNDECEAQREKERKRYRESATKKRKEAGR